MNKYSTKRSHHTTTFDSYSTNSNSNKHHRRDYSPGGGGGGGSGGTGRSQSRNSSPDSRRSWSPRPGGGSYSSSTRRRSKERDSSSSKYYDGGGGKSSSKYMRLSSPHDSARSSISATAFKSSSSSSHHNSKDYGCDNGHSSSTKKAHFGDWSEQISSSGKRYYYNSKTEASQWDKPKEWIEWEKRHSSSRYSSSSSSSRHHHHHHRDKTNNHDNDIDSNNPKSYSYSNNDLLSSSTSSCHRDHHHNHHHHHNNGKLKDSSSYSSSRYNSPGSPRSHYDRINHKTTIGSEKSRLSDDDEHDRKKSSFKAAVDDCPNDDKNSLSSVNRQSSSSSVSSHSHCNNNNHVLYKSEPVKLNHHHQANQQKRNCETVSNSPSINHATDANFSSIMSLVASLIGQSSQPNLSKLLSQLNNFHGLNLMNNRNLTRAEELELLGRVVHLSQKSQQQNQTNAKTTPESTVTATRLNSAVHQNQAIESNNSQCKIEHSNKINSLRVDLVPSSSSSSLQASGVNCSPGASTTQPSVDKNSDVPASSTSALTISSIGSTLSQKDTVPDLSRFKHLFREDLIGHVSGWYSEQLEQQANALFAESNQIGNLVTKVSAELKSARSAVRVWEIQTTLQKQRILFTSQQIKTIEEWRGRQFVTSSVNTPNTMTATNSNNFSM